MGTQLYITRVGNIQATISENDDPLGAPYKVRVEKLPLPPHGMEKHHHAHDDVDRIFVVAWRVLSWIHENSEQRTHGETPEQQPKLKQLRKTRSYGQEI